MVDLTEMLVKASKAIFARAEPLPDFLDSQKRVVMIDDVLSINDILGDKNTLALVRGFMLSEKGLHVIIEKENGARTNLLQSVAEAKSDRIISLTASEREPQLLQLQRWQLN